MSGDGARTPHSGGRARRESAEIARRTGLVSRVGIDAGGHLGTCGAGLAAGGFMETSPVIAKIIQSCLDDERTLVQESKLVDSQRKAVLIRLADERRHFAEELERLNGQGSRESWTALVRELGNGLWARMTGRNAGDAVAECRRSQRRTEARYELALGLELPREVKDALVIQHERVHAARDELTRLEF